ncbi:MAG: hypothetical protein AAGE52_40840 [Myxococcota bacterium]
MRWWIWLVGTFACGSAQRAVVTETAAQVPAECARLARSTPAPSPPCTEADADWPFCRSATFDRNRATHMVLVSQAGPPLDFTDPELSSLEARRVPARDMILELGTEEAHLLRTRGHQLLFFDHGSAMCGALTRITPPPDVPVEWTASETPIVCVTFRVPFGYVVDQVPGLGDAYGDCDGSSCMLRLDDELRSRVENSPLVTGLVPLHPLYKISPSVICPNQDLAGSDDYALLAELLARDDLQSRELEVTISALDEAANEVAASLRSRLPSFSGLHHVRLRVADLEWVSRIEGIVRIDRFVPLTIDESTSDRL